ncbi:hypothetical protein B0H13DRAFT_1886611 [Mycena leptocephala]|nr:hypothetical protein B0H13DRAFT_1886611 [Mycena leptocephala]
MGTEIPSFTSHFSATEIIDFVGLKFGRRTSGGSSVDRPQAICRSSADGLLLITNAAFKQGARFGIMAILMNARDGHFVHGIRGAVILQTPIPQDNPGRED